MKKQKKTKKKQKAQQNDTYTAVIQLTHVYTKRKLINLLT